MDSQQTDRPLCDNGCGFYGSVANQNLCSKCYRDFLKEEFGKSAKTPSSSSILVGSLKTQPSSSSDQSITFESAIGAGTTLVSGSTSTKKNRCRSCNKKVGLTGFDCRCGNVFCGVHRYPNEHSCTFDFMAVGRDALVKENPVCKGDKLEWRI